MEILIDTNILVDYFRSRRSSRPKNQRQAYLCQQAVQFIDQSIAATAIAFNLPLYTRNPGDFKYVPHSNLKIVVPYQYQSETAY